LVSPSEEIHEQFLKIESGWRFYLKSYDLIKDYSLRIERSTRIKDYHSKGCMVWDKNAKTTFQEGFTGVSQAINRYGWGYPGLFPFPF